MNTSSLALFAFAVSSLLATTDACANRYKLVDLGQRSASWAVNDRNVVSGFNGQGSGRWRKGVWTILSYTGHANAINEKGRIAGSDRRGVMTPIVWERPQVGGSHFIDIPDGFAYGEATAISNDGAVVGYFVSNAAGAGCFLAKDGYHPEFFDWPLEQGCRPTAVNRKGQIAGYLGDEAADQAFLWTDGQFQLLGQGQAFDVNDAGNVVGVGSPGDGAVLWHDGVQVVLDKSDRFPQGATEALGINNLGVIVGRGYPASDGHNDPDPIAVRFEGGRSIPLSSEVRNSNGWHLHTAYAVNNNGVILASASFSHVYRAVLLFPLEGGEAKGEDSSASPP
jgi:uncharacterized membrane protein